MASIRAKKPLDGRKPRHHKILIPICTRGRVLWFVNDARCVTFAFQAHKQADLSWFLHQINDDIQEILAEGQPARAPPEPDTATVEQEDLAKCKKILLDNLKGYSPCKYAWFLNTKLLIRVTRSSDGTRREFGIQSTSRTRFRVAEFDYVEAFANLEARIKAWLRAPVEVQAPALEETEYYDPMDAGANPESPNGSGVDNDVDHGLGSGSADGQILPEAEAVADAADAAPEKAIVFLDLDETQVQSYPACP